MSTPHMLKHYEVAEPLRKQRLEHLVWLPTERPMHALKRYGVSTVGHLADLLNVNTDQDLLRVVPGIGIKGLESIHNAMRPYRKKMTNGKN